MSLETTNPNALDVLDGLESYASLYSKKPSQLSEQLHIPRSTIMKWYGKNRRMPSNGNIQAIHSFLNNLGKVPTSSPISLPIQGVSTPSTLAIRALKVKCLLTLLGDELIGFSNSTPQARMTLRDVLNNPDTGYVTSLLTMMSNEEKFKRWCALTTKQFNYYKGV